MITLLRKIRKRLIKNGNVSSYLLYAIGEIALVVIGILIALQINNWNEQRKLNIKEQALLQQLLTDLKKDAQILKESIPILQQKNQTYQQLYYETKGERKYDSSIAYGDFTWQVFAPLSFAERHQNSTAQLSSKEQRNQMLDYFKLQHNSSFQLVQFNEYIQKTLRPFLGNRGVMNIEKVMRADNYKIIEGDKSDFIDYSQLQKLFGDQEFEFILFQLRMSAIAMVYRSQLLLDANEALSKRLKEHLN